ncbi:PilW family protein [Thalassotalea sp. ND16A]|uniref:PilW family protein n=1 Tax=Thalassotalea sp. ND16A TaxID=1535422 RepID=UPI000519F038|nr:type II secretion system protein [Thalassotalea sp. ND16A]KGJ98945.1 hypothetical protein ND16A_0467 [Thalassotalea sp. ND16A]
MNKGHLYKTSKGFTLVELVLVIAILSITSVGFIGFITIGSKVYQDVSGRDALISDARFAIERLNRELSNALPNSVRIIDDGSTQCLEFVPIVVSSFYLDIPLLPDPPKTTFDVVKASSDYQTNSKDMVIVYPIASSDIYDHASSKKAIGLTSVAKPAGNKWRITIDSAFSFAAESPSGRLFIVSEPVSFCATNGSLHRHQNYGFSINQSILSGGVLMAEHIDVCHGSCFPFVFDAILQRAAIVQVNFKFSKNNDNVFFSNGVHISNVP